MPCLCVPDFVTYSTEGLLCEIKAIAFAIHNADNILPSFTGFAKVNVLGQIIVSLRTRRLNLVFVKSSILPKYTHNSPLFTISTTHVPPTSRPLKKPNPLYRAMSQAFLHRLLSSTQSRVRSDKGANCMICLEDYNTLNISTGVVEQEVVREAGRASVATVPPLAYRRCVEPTAFNPPFA